MGIDRLNSAVWAAGFAMAPTEDDALEAIAHIPRDSIEQTGSGQWQSARIEAPGAQLERTTSASGGLRQWLAGLQRRATA